MGTELELRVAEAPPDDAGKGWARLDTGDIKALGGVLGDLVEIRGARTTVARLTGTLSNHSGKKLIQIDGITRSNGQISLGEPVQVRKIHRKTAETVLITPLDLTAVFPEKDELEQFSKVVQGLPVICGDRINVPFFGGKRTPFHG